MEKRYFNADLEIRAEGDSTILVGHAAVFDQLSENLGGFREQIKPGAFKENIDSEDIRALANHDTSKVMARTGNKTLALKEDKQGLYVEITPNDTTHSRDMVEMIKRGDINQMSFGFTVNAGGDDWTEDDEGRVIRTLTDVRLHEVSPVTFPAYPQTDIAMRSLEKWREETAPAKISESARIKARIGNKIVNKIPG